MEFINILDLDIYSRRISFFYGGKEKISSKFGFFLTSLYIVISIALFLNFFIRTISREEVTASDSTIHPDTIPSININEDIFNLAFGLEHPSTFSRFIDETIYYPKISYIEKIKKNGIFVNKLKINVEAEKCKNSKFGQNFQKLLEKGELNNSYCLSNYNLTLKGGFQYSEVAFIKISIFPCKNSTENNITCKPQNVIDKFFHNNYFSILAKDTALNPSDFSNPGLPILLNTYTSVDKQIKKDYYVKFAITEIETDTGLFSQQIKKDKFLRYTKDFDDFFFVDSNYFTSGKEILSLTIRIEDNIYFQKRTYKKMAEVFASTGGYMQLIYSIFAIISILTKTMNIEKKLINSLFYFNIKQKKVILSIEYKKKLNYTALGSSIEKTEDIKETKQIWKNSEKNKKINFIPYIAKKSPLIRKYSKFVKNEKKNEKSLRKSVSLGKDTPIPIKNNNGQNDASIDGLLNIPKIKEYNRKKYSIVQSNKILNNTQMNRLYLRNKTNESENMEKLEKENFNGVDFNLFEYYCFWKLSKKKLQIELFKFAYKFFKSQMDIVNFFNIIILTQIMMKKQSNEKNNFLSEIVELSM